MKDEVAIEKVKKSYMDNYHIKSIHIEQVSEVILSDVVKTCESTKHMEEIINWYNDEENVDENTWTDVEGEGYGWIWVDNPEDKWHDLLKESLLEYIDKKRELIAKKEEKVIIVITENKTIYHFIERESSMCDTIYTFSDVELDI